MLMMIFGAGASYDSVDLNAVAQVGAYHQHRPPLARDLFSDRPNFNAALQAYPQFGGRLLAIRRAARQPNFDVERELQAIRDTILNYPAARSELAAVQFYLQRIIRECGDIWQQQSAGATNYLELLARVDRWKRSTGKNVALTTFNYDLLLDQAVAQFPMSLRPTDVEGYVSGIDYKLFKLHGSVNWGQRVYWNPDLADDEVARQLIEAIDSKQLTPDYVMMSGLGPTHRYPNEPNPWAVLPAIAIPVTEKSEFACPDSHLRELDKWVPAVTHVISIGWRGAEGHFAERFLRPLQGATQFLVVAASEAEAQEACAILSASVPGNVNLKASTSPGFTAFLATKELEGFLAN
jgi:hypothetical protein